MELEYGAVVEDKDKKALGTVDHIVLDMWTGEQRKFVMRREAPQTDLFFSPKHVASATGEKVTLNISLDKLEQENKE